MEKKIITINNRSDNKPDSSWVSESSCLKKCCRCDRELLASIERTKSCFYLIKAKGEKKIRWEDNCKECKKIIRNERKENNVSNIVNSNVLENQSNEKLKKNEVALQELQNTKKIEAHKHQSNMLSKQIDFSELEKCTKEPLTDSKKKEAVDNFNKFISILLEEHKKQTGEHIYVKNK